MVITFRQKNPLMPTVRLRYGNSAELYRPASLFRLAIGCSIYYGQSIARPAGPCGRQSTGLFEHAPIQSTAWSQYSHSTRVYTARTQQNLTELTWLEVNWTLEFPGGYGLCTTVIFGFHSNWKILFITWQVLSLSSLSEKQTLNQYSSYRPIFLSFSSEPTLHLKFGHLIFELCSRTDIQTCLFQHFTPLLGATSKTVLLWTALTSLGAVSSWNQTRAIPMRSRSTVTFIHHKYSQNTSFFL